MQKELNKYLFDIHDCCLFILDFTSGKNYNDYANDRSFRSAIERELITIGEALNQAKQLYPEIVEAISHYKNIIAFRNHLVHGYSLILDEVAWGIIREYLPTLEKETEKLLNNKD